MSDHPKRNRLLWLGGVVLLLALTAYAARGRGSSIRYVAAPIRVGDVRDVVEATGTVNPVVTVQVGSQVSGTIAQLNADFNSRVHKGDVIALIEPSVLRGIRLQAGADLENAKASVTAAEANLDKARAAVVQAQADYDRSLTLAKTGDLSQQAVELATATYEAAKAEAGMAAAGVAQAKAQVSQREAAASVAQTNLEHPVIRSPIDGILIAGKLDVGRTGRPSLQAPVIFSIAQDLRKMQLYAKIDESDVGRIRLAQAVSFKVDAFPGQTFKGVVSQVRMSPTLVQNVVTYDAIVEFANPELKLFPGMTAYLTVPVATAEHVTMLPNAALRFRPPLPPDQIRGLYRKFGIEDAGPREAGKPAESAVAWKLSAGDIEPVQVKLGITDHAFTEISGFLKGSLKEGDSVATRALGARATGPIGTTPAGRP